MKRKFLAPVVLSTVLMVTACSHKKDDSKKEMTEPVAATTQVTQEGLNLTTATWPEPSKAAINGLTERYGLPTSVTEEIVVWEDTAPFKRSIVFKEQIDHQFPVQHVDVLAQTVDYRVPFDKLERISKFDGSLLVDRTKGELTARNNNEEMNILSLNLADKIVRGELTVEQARREYSTNAEAFAAGTSNSLLTSLSFTTKGSTSDPDTMMQSQTDSKESDQPVIRKTFEAEEVRKVIEE